MGAASTIWFLDTFDLESHFGRYPGSNRLQGHYCSESRYSKNLFLSSYIKGLAIVAALVASMVEEIIFHGFVMTTLKQMNPGNLVQVLLSGLFFALAHVYGIFTSPLTLLTTQGFTFLLGVALATVYLIGKRSPTPTIMGHALTDLIIEPALLLFFFTAR